MSSISLATWPTILFVSSIRAFACTALSAFCLVMEAIWSSDADDSSRADACWDIPPARLWLAVETSFEALATWFAAPSMSAAIFINGRAIPRPKKTTTMQVKTRKTAVTEIRIVLMPRASAYMSPISCVTMMDHPVSGTGEKAAIFLVPSKAYSFVPL